jgi:hypothetical protein
LARVHARTLENLESVLCLGEKHSLEVTSDGKAEEVMKIAQVGHGELRTESGDWALFEKEQSAFSSFAFLLVGHQRTYILCV